MQEKEIESQIASSTDILLMKQDIKYIRNELSEVKDDIKGLSSIINTLTNHDQRLVEQRKEIFVAQTTANEAKDTARANKEEIKDLRKEYETYVKNTKDAKKPVQGILSQVISAVIIALVFGLLALLGFTFTK